MTMKSYLFGFVAAALTAGTLFSPIASANSADGELGGKWRDNTCSFAESFGKTYRQRTYLFDKKNDRAVLLSKFFSDKKCTDYKFSYRIVADFSQEVTNEEKAKGNFELEYRKQTFKVRNSKVARQFNKDKVCGITKWKAKEYFTIDGKDCFGLGIPKQGYELKGKYNINRAGDRVKVTFKGINGKDHVVKLDVDGKEDQDDL